MAWSAVPSDPSHADSLDRSQDCRMVEPPGRTSLVFQDAANPDTHAETIHRLDLWSPANFQSSENMMERDWVTLSYTYAYRNENMPSIDSNNNFSKYWQKIAMDFICYYLD